MIKLVARKASNFEEYAWVLTKGPALLARSAFVFDTPDKAKEAGRVFFHEMAAKFPLVETDELTLEEKLAYALRDTIHVVEYGLPNSVPQSARDAMKRFDDCRALIPSKESDE